MKGDPDAPSAPAYPIPQDEETGCIRGSSDGASVMIESTIPVSVAADFDSQTGPVCPIGCFFNKGRS